MTGTFLRRVLAAATVVLALGVPAWAQHTSVKGKVTDASGPVAGARVEFFNTEKGNKYTLTTDKNGEYFSLGISPGVYRVTLSKDGQILWTQDNVHLEFLEEGNVGDFDLPKLRAAAMSQPGQLQLTPEQLKKIEEAQKKAREERATVQVLNEKLAAANAAEQANNWGEAVTILTEATALDPTRHELWASLCQAELGANRFEDAATHCQKGITLAQQQPKTDPVRMAQYHNNLGQAYAKAGRTQEAAAEYTAAAAADPAGAATYYFNLGAILTNEAARQSDQAARIRLIDQATEAFDKATIANPSYAEAYYQKAVNLLGKATLDKNNKMVAPPGTAEAFNKYLELEPTGRHAEEVKGMLTYIGAEVQTTFKKGKAK
jgi:tetratricopeptide (TPR) repeat protein